MKNAVAAVAYTRIRTLTELGMHADGRGLYLQIRPGGARSWIYRFNLNGRARDMGLGALANVTLVKARAKAAAARVLRDDGIDPIEQAGALAVAAENPKGPKSPIFEEAAEAYMADKLKRLRSDVHRHQCRRTLETYAYPIIGDMPVAILKPAKCWPSCGRFGTQNAKPLQGSAAALKEFWPGRRSKATELAPTPQRGAVTCKKPYSTNRSCRYYLFLAGWPKQTDRRCLSPIQPSMGA